MWNHINEQGNHVVDIMDRLISSATIPTFAIAERMVQSDRTGAESLVRVCGPWLVSKLLILILDEKLYEYLDWNSLIARRGGSTSSQ